MAEAEATLARDRSRSPPKREEPDGNDYHYLFQQAAKSNPVEKVKLLDKLVSGMITGVPKPPFKGPPTDEEKPQPPFKGPPTEAQKAAMKKTPTMTMHCKWMPTGARPVPWQQPMQPPVPPPEHILKKVPPPPPPPVLATPPPKPPSQPMAPMTPAKYQGVPNHYFQVQPKDANIVGQKWRSNAQRWGNRGGFKTNPTVRWHCAKARALHKGINMSKWLRENPKPPREN